MICNRILVKWITWIIWIRINLSFCITKFVIQLPKWMEPAAYGPYSKVIQNIQSLDDENCLVWWTASKHFQVIKICFWRKKSLQFYSKKMVSKTLIRILLVSIVQQIVSAELDEDHFNVCVKYKMWVSLSMLRSIWVRFKWNSKFKDREHRLLVTTKMINL